MFFNSCPNNRRHKDSWEFLWRHSVNKSAQAQKKQAGKWPWSSSPLSKGEPGHPLQEVCFPHFCPRCHSTKILWAQVRLGVVDEGVNEHFHAQASRLFFSPHLWTRTLRNLKSSCWGGDSFLTQCGLSILFLTENCGLRLANSHPSCFTLSCKSWDQWSRQRNLSSFSHFSSSSVIFSPSKPTICFLFTPAPVPTEWSV